MTENDYLIIAPSVWQLYLEASPFSEPGSSMFYVLVHLYNDTPASSKELVPVMDEQLARNRIC